MNELKKPNQSPEGGEKKQKSTDHELVDELSLSSKKETKLKFAIPANPGSDSAYFNPCSDTIGDTGLEYTTLENTLYPGVYKNNAWESTDEIEEDTFLLAITYYDQNLYTITVLDNSRDKEEYPDAEYPDEMKELLNSVAEKWNISFPLIDEDFEKSKIIVNKIQLDQFLTDLKIDATEVFRHSDKKDVDIPESGFVKTEEGYEIKNVFPTDFADQGTFSQEKISLESADSGDDIYVSCLTQKIEGKNITNAGLEKLIKDVSLTCLPDNKIQVKIQPTVTNHFSWMSVEMGWSEHNEYGNLMRFLQENLRKQYTIAKKWNIDMPLVSGLQLDYISKSIILDASKLQDFMHDLGIKKGSVVLPK